MMTRLAAFFLLAYMMTIHADGLVMEARTSDFAVDLYSQATNAVGSLALSPITLRATTHTIEVQVYSRLGFGCILSMGNSSTANYFAIQIDNEHLVVRVGSPYITGFILATSDQPLVQYNNWYTISVVVQNVNNINARVTAFVNGTLAINNITTLSLPLGSQYPVLIGECRYSASLPQGPGILNGIVDNFRVWNTTRTPQDIQSVMLMVDKGSNLTYIVSHPSLISFFPFNEGRGTTSSDLVLGSLMNAQFNTVFWIVKGFGELTRQCSESDDKLVVYVPGQPTDIFSPPQLLGQWQHTSCGPNFNVRVYRTPTAQWNSTSNCDIVSCGPTAVSSFNVKAFDDIFYMDTTGKVSVRALDGTIYTPLNFGSATRSSGVHFTYTLSHFFLEVPTVGTFDASFGFSEQGSTQAQLNIYHTLFCESPLMVTGSCRVTEERLLWSQFMFINESFCGDQYVSGTEQCDGSPSCLNNCTCAFGTNPSSALGLCSDVCGNKIVTGLEHCDSTYGCDSRCKCIRGTKSVNGRCVDVCGDGIVTGAEECDSGQFCNACKCVDGYRPTSPSSDSCEVIPVDTSKVPDVVPILDCLTVVDAGVLKLYLGYDNLEGSTQVIEHGKYNLFVPADSGTTRPSVFFVGRSLSYPVSPYITTISTSVTSFSWLLGSFNLTVDLSNISHIQCPKVPEIVIELTAPANLTDEIIHTIVDNIADMYNISSSRINMTVLVNTTTQPPTYTLVITIDNMTNTTERDALQVILDLFQDLKQNQEDTTTALIDGLADTNIKSIITRPTSVEVRGQPTNSNDWRAPSPTTDSVSNGVKEKVSVVLILLLISLIYK